MAPEVPVAWWEAAGLNARDYVQHSREGAQMSTDVMQDTRFRQTRFRAGYDPDEVDAFVEAVADSLRSPIPRLDASDVAWQRFSSVILKRGYDRDDVDDYLSEAEHLLGQREYQA
jgi:DivIVA domain-containing protein